MTVTDLVARALNSVPTNNQRAYVSGGESLLAMLVGLQRGSVTPTNLYATAARD